MLGSRVFHGSQWRFERHDQLQILRYLRGGGLLPQLRCATSPRILPAIIHEPTRGALAATPSDLPAAAAAGLRATSATGVRTASNVSVRAASAASVRATSATCVRATSALRAATATVRATLSWRIPPTLRAGPNLQRLLPGNHIHRDGPLIRYRRYHTGHHRDLPG